MSHYIEGKLPKEFITPKGRVRTKKLKEQLRKAAKGYSCRLVWIDEAQATFIKSKAKKVMRLITK